MKKLVCVASATFLLCMASACNNNGSNKGGGSSVDCVMVEDEDSSVLTFGTVKKDASVKVGKYGSTSVSLNCVYPIKGEKVLKDSINAFLEQLLVYEEGEKALAVKGDGIKAMLLNFVPELLESNKKDVEEEIKSMVEYAESDEELDKVGYEDGLEVTVGYEDDKYVTLYVSNYTYRNSVHGLTTSYGVTFSKKDGHICGNELLKNYSKAQLQPLMLEGLREYFAFGEGKVSVAELAEDVDIDSKDLRGNIPMPSTEAYLMKDGIHLIYQQYEIAAYAAGMPEIVVPVK